MPLLVTRPSNTATFQIRTRSLEAVQCTEYIVCTYQQSFTFCFRVRIPVFLPAEQLKEREQYCDARNVPRHTKRAFQLMMRVRMLECRRSVVELFSGRTRAIINKPNWTNKVLKKKKIPNCKSLASKKTTKKPHLKRVHTLNQRKVDAFKHRFASESFIFKFNFHPLSQQFYEFLKC